MITHLKGLNNIEKECVGLYMGQCGGRKGLRPPPRGFEGDDCFDKGHWLTPLHSFSLPLRDPSWHRGDSLTVKQWNVHQHPQPPVSDGAVKLKLGSFTGTRCSFYLQSRNTARVLQLSPQNSPDFCVCATSGCVFKVLPWGGSGCSDYWHYSCIITKRPLSKQFKMKLISF